MNRRESVDIAAVHVRDTCTLCRSRADSLIRLPLIGLGQGTAHESGDVPRQAPRQVRNTAELLGVRLQWLAFPFEQRRLDPTAQPLQHTV